MSSLGYINNSQRPRPPPPPTSQTVVIKTSIAPMRPPLQLNNIVVYDKTFALIAGLYFVTFVVHTSLLVYIVTTTFVYPLTLFQTRIKPEVVDSFRCVYDYGQTADGDFFCSDDSLVATGNRSVPSQNCVQALFGYAQNIMNSSNTATQGPWIQAYEIRPILDGEGGALAAKVMLIIIQSVTLTADLIKAFSLLSGYKNVAFRKELYSRSPVLQWLEYSVSASFMTVFVAVMSHNFDVNFAVSTLLGTMSLMYIGWLIDVCLIEINRYDLSLVLLWQPGMLLFAAAWWPVYASLEFMSEVTCKDPNNSSLFCEPGCFLSDYRYTLLSFGTFGIFVFFPLVSLYKCFVFSGKYDEWLLGVSDTFQPLLAPIAFLGYIPYSFCRSIYNTTRYLFLIQETNPPPSEETKRRVFVVGLTLNGILSLTAKTFLTLTFVMSFATRFPWRTIQRSVA